MKATLTGKVSQVFAREQISDKFTKRVLWLEGGAPDRPQTWEIEAHNKDCAEFDKVQKNNNVTVEVEIRGRLSTKGNKDRVYNSLKCLGLKIN